MTPPATSSGVKSSSTAISVLPGRLRGVQALADGTNAATIIIYDNATTNSGTELAKIVVKAGDTHGEAFVPTKGVVANKGIYAAISGTGAACIVYFDIG